MTENGVAGHGEAGHGEGGHGEAGHGEGGPRLSEGQFRELYERLRAMPSWGPEDRRGALNFLTPERVAAAAREVRLGRSVSLSWPLEDSAGPDNPEPVTHELTRPASVRESGHAGDADRPGLAFATDRFAMNVHGDADSHIDALCHVIYDGRLYNDVGLDALTPSGARQESIEVAADGIAGRGVLLDIPRLRGVPWLEPGDHVTAAELARAEQAQGVRAGPGDVLLVRTGHSGRRTELGAWDAAGQRAGLHPAAVAFVAQRQVAVLGSDSNSDTAPSLAAGTDFPVHVLAINALGVHLLDYLQFEDLAPLCAASGRWSFLCVIAPLRLPRGTGSPVNPLAIL